MATKARLTDDLKLVGEVDERLPSVTDGLIAHYPLDNTVQATTDNNSLDYSTWVIGSSGSQSGFGQNGDGNSIINDVDPFGNHTAIWQALNNDVDSNADGGWNGTQYPIDNTETYRFSVWIQRRVLGNGTYYLGLSDTGGNVLNRSNGLENTNPYFRATSGSGIFGDWFLVVGHVWPTGSGTGSVHVDTGVYTKTGSKIATPGDFIWSTTTAAGLRTYLYYSTQPITEQLWAYPRVDKCDGSEPTIDDLIAGRNGDGSTTNPIDNANITITEEGVSVETATTNIVDLPAPSIWNNSGTHISVQDDTRFLNPPIAGEPILSIKKLIAGSTGLTIAGTNPTTPSTTYSYSCWFWQDRPSLTGSQPYIRHYPANANGGSFKHQGETNWNNWPQKEWIWITATYTSAADATHTRLSCYLGATDDTVAFQAHQSEQNNYATSYVSGSRSAGQLSIVNPVSTGEYTINFKCKLNTNIGDASSYQTVMQMGNYSTNNSWTIMDYNGSNVLGRLRLIREGNAAEWAWLGADLTDAADINTWCTITIVRNGTYYRGYKNGVYVGQLSHLSTTMQDKIWIGSRTSGGSAKSSTIKDLSIYNRALNDSEVSTVVNNKLQITYEGDLKNVVLEKPAIPASIKYFPLGENANDETQLTNPTTETNTRYRDGGVFLGTGTTNTVTNGVTPYGGYHTFSLSGHTATMVMLASSQFFVLYPTGFDPYLKTVSVSGYIKKNGEPWYFKPSVMSTYQSSGNVSHSLANSTTGYFEHTLYYATDNSWVFHCSTGGSVEGDVFTIEQFQVEEKNYSTAFTEGTLAGASLHYPYDMIDCKVDFTVFGFWKPKVYADGLYRPCIVRNVANTNSTYNRILIMGNGTTSRRLRCWHGSNGTTESNVYAPSTIDVLNDEWNFFALVRSGANMLLYLGNSEGFGSGSSATAYQLDNDETGQVWQVGEYSNNESDAYHKDYGFIQRALTNEELKVICHTKLRCLSTEININNQIIEGVVL